MDNQWISSASLKYHDYTCVIIGQLTHQPAVVSAVIEEQLLVRVDLCGCTEEQFTVGRVRHQVRFLTGSKHTYMNTANRDYY